MDPPIERHGFLRTASLSGGVQTPPLRDRSPLLKEIIIFTCYGIPSLNGGVQTPPLTDSILRVRRRKKKYWRHKARPGPGPAQARPGPGPAQARPGPGPVLARPGPLGTGLGVGFWKNLVRDQGSGSIRTTPRSGISMRIYLDRSKASQQL